MDDAHELLIEKGLKFYDTFQYQQALPFLKNAYEIAPKCICAKYNFANVLHMLDKHKEAYDLLLEIIATTPAEAKQGCPDLHNSRAFIIDAHFLIFNVIIHGQGFSEEAFDFANKHLALRTQGVSSVWTQKEVQKEIADFKKEWKNEA